MLCPSSWAPEARTHEVRHRPQRHPRSYRYQRKGKGFERPVASLFQVGEFTVLRELLRYQGRQGAAGRYPLKRVVNFWPSSACRGKCGRRDANAGVDRIQLSGGESAIALRGKLQDRGDREQNCRGKASRTRPPKHHADAPDDRPHSADQSAALAERDA